jgi:hypothetical protein
LSEPFPFKAACSSCQGLGDTGNSGGFDVVIGGADSSGKAMLSGKCGTSFCFSEDAMGRPHIGHDNEWNAMHVNVSEAARGGFLPNVMTIRVLEFYCGIGTVLFE